MIVGRERIENLLAENSLTQHQKGQLFLLIVFNKALELPFAAARRMCSARRLIDIGLFLIWVCWCWLNITPQNPRPSCRLFFNSLAVPPGTWSKCLRLLNDKSRRIQNGEDL